MSANLNVLIILEVPGVGFIIRYASFEGRYINMSKRLAEHQFREDFGLKGQRLERL